jgi:hypothetical protein
VIICAGRPFRAVAIVAILQSFDGLEGPAYKITAIPRDVACHAERDGYFQSAIENQQSAI